MNGFYHLIKKYSKTVGEATEVDKITSIGLAYQRVFGLQVLDPNWTWRKHSILHILNLILFIYVFIGTLRFLNTTDDVNLIAQASYTLIMLAIFTVKMALYIRNRFIFRNLYLTAKTALIEVIKADPLADIKKILSKGNRIVNTLFSSLLVPCSMYELTTLWNYVNGRRILLSPTTSTLMPMTSPYYEIGWFLHSVFLFELGSTIILDMWFVLLIYFLCAASDSLVRMLNVEKRRVSETRLEYALRLNNALKKFYVFHVEQIEYLNLLNLMYKWLALLPLLNASLGMCIILLLISKEFNWRFAPHMLPTLAEIFVYNWFGEQIKTKASNLNMALLDFDWTNLRMQDKKSYYIIVCYMQKEFGLKTAIGKDLSLITMTAVLKVSYQAFTVLQTVEK